MNSQDPEEWPGGCVATPNFKGEFCGWKSQASSRLVGLSVTVELLDSPIVIDPKSGPVAGVQRCHQNGLCVDACAS